MDTFFVIAYSISLCVAIITLFALILVVYYRWHTLNVLPYALRLTTKICYYPFAFLFTISAAGAAISCLIKGKQNSSVVDVFSIGIITSSQTLRQYFLCFVLERIISTIFLEKYTYLNKIFVFWVLIFFTFFSTLIYLGCVIFYSSVTIIYSLSLLQMLSYYVFAVHLITCFICGILYFLNKRMYRVTAYQISLQKRHKIMQNIKILSFMFPTILIFTLFVPTWSIIVMIGSLVRLPHLPNCIQHIFNMLPLFFISLRHFLIGRQKFAPKLNNKITGIRNAFGKTLPTTFTTDKYFQSLKQMWE